jgi:hypothetical protein
MNESNNQASERKPRFFNHEIFASHGNSHIAVGIIILLLGILFLLGNLGLFYVRWPGLLWPVIPIGIGLARIIQSPNTRGKFWGAVIAGVGVIFLLSILDIFPWDPSKLLFPFLLICLGAAVLVRGFGGRFQLDHSQPFHNDASKSPDNTSNNFLNAEVIFGGVNRRIQAQDFQGGKASAVFGGVEIDLRGSATTRDEIHIEANAVFGGVELTVPDAWDVIVRGTGVLGGYEDKTHPAFATTGAKRPRLIIEGAAVFGGVTVRS